LALVLIPITLAIAYLFNTGELLERKIKVQNAADAAAMSQATAMARALNVMSMNNVAIAQSLSISTVLAALRLSILDMEQYLIREGITDTYGTVTSCSLCAVPPYVACVACAKYALSLAAVITAAIEMGPYAVAVHQALPQFQQNMRAYASYNDHLESGFAAYSSRLQANLAAANGLSRPPRLQIIGWSNSPGAIGQNFDRTGLPVTRVSGIPSDTSILSTVQRFALNQAGLKGTQRRSLLVARNFLDHGYAEGTGPYPVARDDVVDSSRWRLAQTLAKLTGWTPYSSQTSPPTKDTVDRCWNTASLLAIVPEACLPVAVGLPPIINLWGIAANPGISDLSAIGVYDILVLASSARPTGVVAGARFPNAVPGTYAIAKARVFNAVNPDLYSQDWRAVLVPATAWSGFRTQLPPGFRSAISNLARADAVIARSLQKLSDQDLSQVVLQ
jgi:hypothetical protein